MRRQVGSIGFVLGNHWAESRQFGSKSRVAGTSPESVGCKLAQRISQRRWQQSENEAQGTFSFRVVPLRHICWFILLCWCCSRPCSRAGCLAREHREEREHFYKGTSRSQTLSVPLSEDKGVAIRWAYLGPQKDCGFRWGGATPATPPESWAQPRSSSEASKRFGISWDLLGRLASAWPRPPGPGDAQVAVGRR